MENRRREAATASSFFTVILKHLGIVSLAAIIGYVDYITGYQRPLIALYALPIALAVWKFSLVAGIAQAVLCTLIWGGADILAGHPYTDTGAFALSVANCFVFFVAVALLMHYSIANNELNKRLQKAFCGEVVICAQCEKIHSPGDHWAHFASYLMENSTATVKNKVCPDCARMAYAAFRE